MKEGYKLYKAEITLESTDQFEFDKWQRDGRYVGVDKEGVSTLMLYFHSYEAYAGGKNKTEIKQFLESEVDEVKKKGYNVERFQVRIEEIKEVHNWKISVRPLEKKLLLKTDNITQE